MKENAQLFQWDLANLKSDWEERASSLKRRGLKDEAHEVKTCAKELDELIRFHGARRA